MAELSARSKNVGTIFLCPPLNLANLVTENVELPSKLIVSYISTFLVKSHLNTILLFGLLLNPLLAMWLDLGSKLNVCFKKYLLISILHNVHFKEIHKPNQP